MKLVELEMTCGACPSQWEGKMEDGSHFYARYRFGSFYATVGGTRDEAIWPVDNVIATAEGDDPWDGVMNTDQMLRILARNGVDVSAVL